MIPAGATVILADPATTVDETAQAGLELIEVDWEGRAILMFACDVRERAEQVEGYK